MDSRRATLSKLMIRRMSGDDKIVARYLDGKDFESAAFSALSRAIYDSIPNRLASNAID